MIDDLIKKLDDYCKKFPDYVDGYEFQTKLLRDDTKKNKIANFANEFVEFNKWIESNHEDRMLLLENARKRKTLDVKKINKFKKYNESIKEFNEFLKEISLVFHRNALGDDETVGEFFFDENDMTKVFIKATQFELELLDVPDKPNLEENYISPDEMIFGSEDDD